MKKVFIVITHGSGDPYPYILKDEVELKKWLDDNSLEKGTVIYKAEEYGTVGVEKTPYIKTPDGCRILKGASSEA